MQKQFLYENWSLCILGEMSGGDEVMQVKVKKCSLQNETVETIEKLQNKWFCAVCKQKLLTDRRYNMMYPVYLYFWF